MEKNKINNQNVYISEEEKTLNWEDIQSDSGWRSLKEIQKSKPAICVSTGWLVKENRDVHILMSDYNSR